MIQIFGSLCVIMGIVAFHIPLVANLRKRRGLLKNLFMAAWSAILMTGIPLLVLKAVLVGLEKLGLSFPTNYNAPLTVEYFVAILAAILLPFMAFKSISLPLTRDILQTLKDTRPHG